MNNKRTKRSRKIRNYLWITRKKMGLAQKQVAFLLGHKSTTQLSRYERGTRIPSLKTALKLEIAYAKPLRLLFSELHDEVREDIQKRREKIVVYKELKEKKHA
jgi:transcriptional regulator with XRE-family HTH domain